MKTKLFLVIVFSALLLACNNEDKWRLVSPDGTLAVELTVQDSGKVSYQVFAIDAGIEKNVILPSPLGVVRSDQRFERLSFISKEEVKTVDESYTLITGKKLIHNTRYKELMLHFQNAKKAKLDIVFRAYDEGVAFRYVFPESSTDTFIVNRERTGFHIPHGKAFMQPYGKPTAYAPAYEQNYATMEVGTFDKKEGWCMPALFNVNDYWLLIAEANLGNDFYGSHLGAQPKDGMYRVAPPLNKEAFKYGNNFATSTLPWEMPWRCIIIGSELGDVVESNLVTHVSEQSIIDDPSWIQPGRSAWAWWSGLVPSNRQKNSIERLKYFIDFTQEMSWEYFLIDAGWWGMRDDISKLVQYADKRDVKLLLWYNSGGPINRVKAGPRDKMFEPKARQAEMKRISDLGFKGMKIDFFGSEKQAFMKLYHDILVDAAKYKLLVNFHGCTVPRGWRRTYPNLVSYEAVKGSEAYIYHKDFPDVAPEHCTILPFTRNVVGPMDYTPVAFSVQNHPHKTTYGFELAQSVVYESGIQHFADSPEAYKQQANYVIQFLKNVPNVWDETRLLSGYPGKDVVIARRRNNQWFVGGMNGENKAKDFDVDFSFLPEKANYQVKSITDGDSNTSFKYSKKTISNNTIENISVMPFGGFVMEIKPLK